MLVEIKIVIITITAGFRKVGRMYLLSEFFHFIAVPESHQVSFFQVIHGIRIGTNFHPEVRLDHTGKAEIGTARNFIPVRNNPVVLFRKIQNGRI